MKKDKILNIDTVKLLLSFMIVAIHVYPFTSINQTLDYSITRVLFRVGVPIFLMISSYFILPSALKDKSKLVNFTKKILKLYGIAILIYLPLNLYNKTYVGANILEILKDILINGTFYHLWYFPGLIFGIWITYFLLKKLTLKKSLVVASVLYIIGLFGDSYYGLISDIPFLNTLYNGLFKVFNYTRNGLFYVPIFLIIGYTIQSKKITLPKTKNIIFIFINIVVLLIEGMTLYKFNIPRHNSMYLTLIPLVTFTFIYIITNLQGINKLSREYSTWIYILHPFFIVLVHFATKIGPLSIFNNSILSYLAVLFSTIITIFIFRKIYKLIKKT